MTVHFGIEDSTADVLKAVGGLSSHRCEICGFQVGDFIVDRTSGMNFRVTRRIYLAPGRDHPEPRWYVMLHRHTAALPI